MIRIVYMILVCGMFCQTTTAQETSQNKPHGKVLGEVFGDYYYKISSDTLLFGTGEYQNTEKNHNAFAMRRFNFGYDYTFNETFSARLILEGGDAMLTPNNSRGVYIKIAQVSWNNIFPGSTLIIGSQTSLSWSRFSERVWGYRNVEKTILDFRGHGSSTDFGVSLEGRLNSQGTLGYSVMIGNGRAQRPENDKYKKVYATINTRLFDKKLLGEIYFDYEPNSPTSQTSTIKGFLGYQTSAFTFGVEPFRQTLNHENANNIIRKGVSIYAKAPIAENTQVFIRSDFYDPNSGNTFYKETFFLAGAEFKLVNNISLIPNLWINSYSAERSDITKRDSDVVARVTFAFKML